MEMPETSSSDSFPTKQASISCIELCNASYIDCTQDAPVVLTEELKRVSAINGGKWKFMWVGCDDSNLVYAAECTDASGDPTYLAVVTRGTATDVDFCGLIEELVEDLDVFTQVSLGWPVPNEAKVAAGASDALKRIQTFSYKGLDLLTFISNFFDAQRNASVPLLVTGHSLGGCLSTLIAPWLAYEQQKLVDQIIPVTFAAPTAGDSQFKDYFDKAFPQSLRYFNSLDVVPFAWWDFTTMKDIYVSYGLSTPVFVWGGIDAIEAALFARGLTYVQPNAGSRLLNGKFDKDKQLRRWTEQAEHQHHPKTYLQLLNEMPTGSGVVRPTITTGA